MRYRCLALVLLLAMVVAGAPRAQSPTAVKTPNNGDLELVEKLIVARRDYQKSLENLHKFYVQSGDAERSKQAEDELRQYHRIPHYAYRLELDVPPPNLNGTTNIPDANKRYTLAMTYKDKGWGTDYIDNQRRSEILLQQLLTEYPQSDKISDAAFMLGDVYESKAYKQYRRAAAYYERCFEWNQKTQFDARIRAARIYDKQLNERQKAVELYRLVSTHETDAKRLQEANKRLAELSGQR